MKFLAVLLLALCAVSLVFARNPYQSSRTSDYDSEYDRQDEQRWQGQDRHEQDWQGQDWQGQDRQEPNWHQHDHRRPSSDYMTNSEDPLANEWADVVPFRTKITQRLENSEPLSNQPQIKEKLMKFLEDKVQVCKTSNFQKNRVNKQCMGRLTGQMMQMIAAFEKGTQDMPGSYDW